MAIPRLTSDDTVLLVVDLQEKLLPIIHDHAAVTARAVALIEGCRALGVPPVLTEQYPKGLGSTVQPVVEALAGQADPIEKLKFSACVAEVRQRIAAMGRRTVLVCGIETHVCVMQTALDLAAEGYMVAVAADAIGSRSPADHDLAINRMGQSGIVIASVEMALMEMVREAGTERFKSLLPVIKRLGEYDAGSP